MSWTRWSQLAALHSRREDEELLEREQLLSAMLLRQRSQRLMFQRWRNVLVQLREAKSAAINRLCCTQNALMKNAFGAIRLLPLERPTYHLISLLMQHWRQQRLCTYWRTWKVTLTLKKASPPPHSCRQALFLIKYDSNPASQLHFPYSFPAPNAASLSLSLFPSICYYCYFAERFG